MYNFPSIIDSTNSVAKSKNSKITPITMSRLINNFLKRDLQIRGNTNIRFCILRAFTNTKCYKLESENKNTCTNDKILSNEKSTLKNTLTTTTRIEKINCHKLVRTLITFLYICFIYCRNLIWDISPNKYVQSKVSICLGNLVKWKLIKVKEKLRSKPIMRFNFQFFKSVTSI